MQVLQNSRVIRAELMGTFPHLFSVLHLGIPSVVCARAICKSEANRTRKDDVMREKEG